MRVSETLELCETDRLAANRYRKTPDLEAELKALLKQIPRGRVATYGALAEALGDRIAARWVGHYLLHHHHTPACVCHRVVRAGGELGQFVGGASLEKAARLGEEGVSVRAGRVDLERFACSEFVTDRPLIALRQLQIDLARRVSLRSPGKLPTLVAGLDVSYAGRKLAIAAYCLVEVSTGDLVWSTTIETAVRFPYISTYLTFRELPTLLKLLDHVAGQERCADVLMVDGSGILHHRGAGIAAHLGVVTGVPTIGVTKKLLCGRLERPDIRRGEICSIEHEGRVLGSAIAAGDSGKRKIYVSPGHRVSVEFAAETTCRLLTQHRLPEPIYWADRLSRRATKEASRGKTTRGRYDGD